MRALLLGFVILVATAAPPAAASRQTALGEADLVSGDALPFSTHGAGVTVPTLEETLALDAEMQAFIEPVKSMRAPREKMVALMRAMEERGMFSLEYAEITRTASGTFHDRQGNCLSFTMLFVTLARAVGLQASFQSVQVPPTWSNEGKVVVATHVNTVVRTATGQETVVDFNIRPFQGEQRSRKVHDSYALGLFYNNLGAEALLRDEYAASLAYLREAAAVRPDIAGLWVNLGVLYARHGRYEHAEAAYLRALEVDGDEPSAMSNLAVVYEAVGERELAAEYRRRVQHYRERNPYYHFASATKAYESQQYDAALASLRRALRLKPDDDGFYRLRGQVQEALGKSREATQSFKRAREYEEAEALRAQSLVELGGLAVR